MSLRHHWAHLHPVRLLALLLGCLVLLLAPAGCVFGGAKASGPTTAPASSTPAAQPPGSGSAEAYCAFVIRVNTQLGTMVNKTFISVRDMTQAKWNELVRYALDHRAELLAVTPAELLPDVELELQWYEAIAAANGDVNAAAVPPGFGEAATRIARYERERCGISNS